MKVDLLNVLRCPVTGGKLHLRNARESEGEIEAGELVNEDESQCYPIVNFVARFVSAENYAENFGLQWNRFRRTQLDSHTGLPISRDQFYEFSGWTPAELAGKRVLDVGCGAGRFAEVALAAGAWVVAVDYSSAVDACWTNHRLHPRLNVVQGNIYHLPFKPGSFDFVYCIGVLQHTPDVRGAFMSLPAQLTRAGRLVVVLYAKLLLDLLWPKYWLRPITKRVTPERLFRLVETMVPVLLPVSQLVSLIPIVGRKLRYAIPVANHQGDWPLSKAQVHEWAVLNTYDMFSPAHDHPQSARTLQWWFEQAGLEDIWVGRIKLMVGRGRKSAGVQTRGEVLPPFRGRRERLLECRGIEEFCK